MFLPSAHRVKSKFIVMTIDEVTLDRPKVGTGFSVICMILSVEDPSSSP